MLKQSPKLGPVPKDSAETPSIFTTYQGRIMTHQEISPPGREPSTHRHPPLVSIVGKSGAGKTTLLEKLVRMFRKRGYRVGTIKHTVHGFDMDHEGKDSRRHKSAGAMTVVISSPRRLGVIRDVAQEEPLDVLAQTYFSDMDLILAEGYKKANKPKIEVFRRQAHKEPLCKTDPNLIAMVSDVSLDTHVPCFGLEDIERIADLVEETFLHG
jgi:molybdopterin-guanine dinucleotide biosynthesis protein B